jgi:TPR repeat protein
MKERKKKKGGSQKSSFEHFSKNQELERNFLKINFFRKTRFFLKHLVKKIKKRKNRKKKKRFIKMATPIYEELSPFEKAEKAEELYFRAVVADRNDQVEHAMLLYYSAARLGHVLACWNIGVSFATGQGNPVNQEKAMEWYEKAFNYGCEDAASALGDRYLYGRKGTQRDYPKSMRYYQTATPKHQYNFAHYQFGVWIGLTDSQWKTSPNVGQAWKMIRQLKNIETDSVRFIAAQIAYSKYCWQEEHQDHKKEERKDEKNKPHQNNKEDANNKEKKEIKGNNAFKEDMENKDENVSLEEVIRLLKNVMLSTNTSNDSKWWRTYCKFTLLSLRQQDRNNSNTSCDKDSDDLFDFSDESSDVVDRSKLQILLKMNPISVRVMFLHDVSGLDRFPDHLLELIAVFLPRTNIIEADECYLFAVALSKTNSILLETKNHNYTPDVLLAWKTLIKRAAMMGHAEAQHALGASIHNEEREINNLIRLALPWHLVAAKQGIAESMMNAVKIYGKIGNSKANSLARMWLERAARLRHGEAQYYLAVALFYGHYEMFVNEKQAVCILQDMLKEEVKDKEKNETPIEDTIKCYAQCFYACILECGLTIPQNSEEAAERYAIASELGASLYNMGEMVFLYGVLPLKFWNKHSDNQNDKKRQKEDGDGNNHADANGHGDNDGYADGKEEKKEPATFVSDSSKNKNCLLSRLLLFALSYDLRNWRRSFLKEEQNKKDLTIGIIDNNNKTEQKKTKQEWNVDQRVKNTKQNEEYINWRTKILSLQERQDIAMQIWKIGANWEIGEHLKIGASFKIGANGSSYRIGFALATGTFGVKQDKEKAKEWFTKASNNGHYGALCHMKSLKESPTVPCVFMGYHYALEVAGNFDKMGALLQKVRMQHAKDNGLDILNGLSFTWSSI